VRDAYVLAGNTGVLRCEIPAFVKEYVAVTSWLKDSAFNIYPSAESGECNYRLTEKYHVNSNYTHANTHTHTYFPDNGHIFSEKPKLKFDFFPCCFLTSSNSLIISHRYLEFLEMISVFLCLFLFFLGYLFNQNIHTHSYLREFNYLVRFLIGFPEMISISCFLC